MKRIHAVSFFRSDQSNYEQERCGAARGIFFVNFLPVLVRAHRHVFPDWELWIYHDNRVLEFPYFRALERMADAGMLRLMPMSISKTLCGSMLWRLRPLFHDQVEWVMCRDLDSLPMHRDKVMVDEAINAGAAVHAILDSESHCGPLMGGMITLHVPSIWETCPEVVNLLPNIDYDTHGADQIHLNRVVWSKLKRKTVIHQRRKAVQYPEAMKTLPVAPQVTELDKVVRHIGGCPNVGNALEVLNRAEDQTIEKIQAIEKEILGESY